MNPIALKRLDAAPDTLEIGARPLSIDDVVSLARGTVRPALAPEARERMRRSAEVMERLHASGDSIYGVTTSVGASVCVEVPKERAAELSLNLLRMHGCGTGRILEEEEAAAVLALRIASLAAGKSGVRVELAERLVRFLDERVLPRIPAEGSVGASGDLTPLSYVAAMLVGEREVSYRGREVPAREALEALGLEPLTLKPKESLALMNGTAVATAIACLAWERARALARLASSITAMTSLAVNGNPSHFDAFIHDAKPHRGQVRVASWIREDLVFDRPPARSIARLQDRYSIRCAPHVIGVLVDALRFAAETLETEFNGVSDNPLVDVESERILHGGNFYGGHVAFVCDSLKTAVANVACLLDRQLLLLCNPEENDGLPRDLKGVDGEGACVHNGFKAVTIATSSLAAEALKLTMPASAFSRSTELHNQDKVPMATIAARDLLRIVEITEQVAAMLTLAVCQAVELRGETACSRRATAILDAVRREVPRLVEDRRMDRDVHAVLAMMREGALPTGDPSLT
ncbi:MAG: aromatic amino acid lyase [Myxococcales bacterium]|nr:aromatic amino acid lyase [Myxococcales bacterium]